MAGAAGARTEAAGEGDAVNLAPAVDAYRAVAIDEVDGDEVRRILDVIPTPDILQVEMCAVRLIWAARDLRQQREENERRRR